MRRWCCSSAGGLARRFLSAPTAVHARPPVPSLPFRRDHSHSHSHAPLPIMGSLFHSAAAAAIVRPPVMAMQLRHYAIKGRSRAPTTPTISKVKKYKMKAPSSMKFRFRTMKDGQIRRWRAGKRHNAHQKSKEAKRRLRKPALVHLAYAKVIKKLNFCG
ncbi:50S ribosomal protein L35 [Hordeum vulgare]|uniref:50S ribosomal protein L35 n=1 Tax=Hordeum vulgare subsp. vulgare TaxID=112509 RepID=F2CUB7_HORVV|nr:uncharacterized protein LOC123437003 [Hordeum vulgare subsp. vulgare]KAE8785019.1 50S ribosomal protein L35 [Hordeum vulgare]KAI5017729.1 hypothetical protein ZWY2020_042617 [Hordeum vulgare]BAJ86438.1 predicted protein [Hordeum vulgare subsp. vulgare]BAJ88491.1 predicted protein [Hordeum vulgare subsp. vulgare]BAJ98496.1 predicted protein [Hordeum vulgare subsp. vulgare]